MPGIELILAAFMPLCLAGSAVFSSCETALFSLTQADRLRLRRINPSAYGAVMRLLASPRSLLIAVLIGNVTVNSAYYVLAAAVGKAFFSTLGQVAFGIGALLVMIAAGEVLPKSIAAAHRVPFCRLLARPLLWCFLLIRPIHAFAEGFVVAPIVRVLVPRQSEDEGSTLSAQELAALLDKGARAGVLESQEKHIKNNNCPLCCFVSPIQTGLLVCFKRMIIFIFWIILKKKDLFSHRLMQRKFLLFLWNMPMCI
ncbi:MAG: DUF21 domain-containing protein, partial [Planctomycetota bacterium]|nr:DUF21 domain-containing protein [Planctomycetota bacterium]